MCIRDRDKEIPHGTAVEITKFSERDSGVVDVDLSLIHI